MNRKIFSIYDAKGKYYNPIYTALTTGDGIRVFQDLSNDPQTSICKYPEDFTLFGIGEFDDQTGMVKHFEAHQPLATALEFKKQEGLKAV